MNIFMLIGEVNGCCGQENNDLKKFDRKLTKSKIENNRWFDILENLKGV